MRFHTQLVFQRAPDYFSVKDLPPLYFIRTYGEDFGNPRSFSLCAQLVPLQLLTEQEIYVYKCLPQQGAPQSLDHHDPYPQGLLQN